MSEVANRKLVKWPFLIGDLSLVALGFYIVFGLAPGNSMTHLAAAVFCVLCGAVAGMLPFILEYRVTARLMESAALGTVMSQLKGIEAVAGQISNATGNWQTVQEHSEKTLAAAKAIADRMTAEVQGFGEFMQKVNDNEKSNLRLELDKLRRAENDWLQVLVRTMDHVHAIHKGALRSGQPRLIEQLTNFQNACRDAARRVGLTPFLPAIGDSFDPARHQLVPGAPAASAESRIEDTIATGYTFQGRMLRPALVKLASDGEKPADPPLPEKTPDEHPAQGTLL